MKEEPPVNTPTSPRRPRLATLARAGLTVAVVAGVLYAIGLVLVFAFYSARPSGEINSVVNQIGDQINTHQTPDQLAVPSPATAMLYRVDFTVLPPVAVPTPTADEPQPQRELLLSAQDSASGQTVFIISVWPDDGVAEVLLSGLEADNQRFRIYRADPAQQLAPGDYSLALRVGNADSKWLLMGAQLCSSGLPGGSVQAAVKASLRTPFVVPDSIVVSPFSAAEEAAFLRASGFAAVTVSFVPSEQALPAAIVPDCGPADH
jgi:hypothetical protein